MTCQLYQSTKPDHGPTTVVFMGQVRNAGTIERTDDDLVHLQNWTVDHWQETAFPVTVADAYKMMYRHKIQAILDVSPPEDHELIKKDLEKYLI